MRTVYGDKQLYTRASVEQALTMHFGPLDWATAGYTKNPQDQRYVVHTKVGWTDPLPLRECHAFVMGIAEGKRLAREEDK